MMDFFWQIRTLPVIYCNFKSQFCDWQQDELETFVFVILLADDVQTLVFKPS